MDVDTRAESEWLRNHIDCTLRIMFAPDFVYCSEEGQLKRLVELTGCEPDLLAKRLAEIKRPALRDAIEEAFFRGYRLGLQREQKEAQ